MKLISTNDIIQYTKEKYHYMRFISYSRKLDKLREKEEREKYGTPFERFLGEILIHFIDED